MEKTHLALAASFLIPLTTTHAQWSHKAEYYTKNNVLCIFSNEDLHKIGAHLFHL